MIGQSLKSYCNHQIKHRANSNARYISHFNNQVLDTIYTKNNNKRDGDGSAGPRLASQTRRIPEGKKSTPNILSVIMETAELLKT